MFRAPNGLKVKLRGQGRVPKPTRRTACTHVSRAMQAVRRHVGFDFKRRLGRRTEAGPRRLLRRVRPPRITAQRVGACYETT